MDRPISSSSSNAQHLPSEVLCEIFYSYIFDHKGSPWVAAHTCYNWRAAAFAYSRLWGQICLFFGGTTREIDNRYGPKGERCLSLYHLQSALGRAKNAPLDIVVESSSPDGNVLGRVNPSNSIGSFWDMMDLLGGSRMKQWRSFILHIPYLQWGDYFDDPSCSLASLETLHLPNWHSQIGLVLDRTSGCLFSLQLRILHSHHVQNILNSRWFPRLSELAILKDPGSRFFWNDRDALRLAAGCTGLESFQITLESDVLEVDFQQNPLPTKLNRLNIVSQQKHWLFYVSTTTNLTHLTIHQELRTGPPLQVAQIRLNQLKYLKVVEGGTLESLTSLICPSLEYLGILCALTSGITPLTRYLKEGYRTDNATYCRLAPRVMDLSFPRYNKNSFQTFFGCMESVKHLKLEAATASIVQIIALFQLRDEEGALVIFPQLESLEVTIRRGDINAELRDSVLEARREAGFPLTSLKLNAK